MKLSKENRIKMMIKDLVLSNIPISIEDFAEKYGLKSRMIRYNMNEIKELLIKYNVDLLYRSKLGFSISQNQKHLIPSNLLDIEEKVYTDFDVNLALFFELILAKEEISAEYLAEKYYSSPSTISRYLQYLEGLDPSTFSLKSIKFKGFILEAPLCNKIEEAIAKLLIKTKDSFLLEDIYELLPLSIKERVSFKKAKELDISLKTKNRKFDIWVDQNSYKKLYFLWLICLLMPRTKTAKVQDIELSENDKDYIESILKDTSNELSLTMKKIIIYNLRRQTITLKKSKHEIQLMHTIKKMIKVNNLSQEFDTRKLANDLLPHLSLTLSRIEQSLPEEENPLAEQLFKKYPNEKKIAISMLDVFSKELNVAFSQNDVSYVLMYLYKNKKNNDYKKLKIAIVCATGRGFSNLMEARLANRFKNIKIVKTVSAFHHESFEEELDLIVSTIPIKVHAIPVVIVSPILGYEDLEKIQRFSDKNEYLNQEMDFTETSYYPLDKSINSIGDYANQLSRITVFLLDGLTEFIDEYEISQEKMFGLVIHMMMAVQRWHEENEEQFDDAQFIYQQIASDHSKLFSRMEQFFTKVEQLLICRINISERISFFHYLT